MIPPPEEESNVEKPVWAYKAVFLSKKELDLKTKLKELDPSVDILNCSEERLANQE